jgi:hypothetical protein
VSSTVSPSYISAEPSFLSWIPESALPNSCFYERTS